MIANNVVIHFTSSCDERELLDLVFETHKVMGLSLLNREVVRLKTSPQPSEYSLVINLVLTNKQEKVLRGLFKRREYKITWSDFDNMED